MGKLLTILGVSEAQQAKLPDVVFKGEKIVDGLQRVYASAPESPKKDQLAKAISESVKVLMAKVQPYLIEEKKEQGKEEERKKEDARLPQEPHMPEPPQPAPPTPKDEEPPKKEEPPKRKQKPTPPPTTPEPPKPEKPKKQDEGHSGKPTDEPMTCDEIKDAIKGLTLIAKMGDKEAADIIKELKIKLKTQNCK